MDFHYRVMLDNVQECLVGRCSSQEPNSTLCAECAYKYWSRSKEIAESSKTRLDGNVYSK